MVESVLKRSKDIRIAFVVIKVNDDLGNAWNQLAQYLSLNRSEVEESVKHE